MQAGKNRDLAEAIPKWGEREQAEADRERNGQQCRSSTAFQIARCSEGK